MKKKRYWLRGGVIGIVLAVAFIVIIGFLPVYCVGLGVDGSSPCRPLKGFDAFLYTMSTLMKDGMPTLIYTLAIPSLAGMIFGLLYNKLKNHKKREALSSKP